MVNNFFTDPVINISSVQLSIEGRVETLELTKFELPKDVDSMTKDERLEWTMQKTLAGVLDVPLILINEALKVQFLLFELFFKTLINCCT